MGLRFGAWSLELWILGLGEIWRAWGSGLVGFRVQGSEFRVWGFRGLGCRPLDLGYGVWGLGFGVWGLGFEVWGLGSEV